VFPKGAHAGCLGSIDQPNARCQKRQVTAVTTAATVNTTLSGMARDIERRGDPDDETGSFGPWVAAGRVFGLKVLSVDLPKDPRPVVGLTVRHRTLSPVVTAFIKCARAVVKPLVKARGI
jgi:hypothetical protein